MVNHSIHIPCMRRAAIGFSLVWLGCIALSNGEVLFQDSFDRGIPGWTAVQPVAAWIEGPMRWQYNIDGGFFIEASNIYSDHRDFSPTATAVMLVNDAITGETFNFRARINAGDDDGCGLVFGYQDVENFFRVNFSHEGRTNGFPWDGWNVDRKIGGQTQYVFGDDGSEGFVPEFVFQMGVPFDVLIQVTAGNSFSLIVVDDPDNTAVQYNLVVAQPLPASAAGQIGLMSWGMAGGNPRGVQFSQLDLVPVGLIGDPDSLENWTPFMPPQANGNTTLAGGNSARPIWSLALGQGGPYGTLQENSDSYAYATDINGNTHIDFTGPTLVAGNRDWTDYLYRVRITPFDDDGQGILLRYQDVDNFYRITSAQQGTGNGRPYQGLSIQKKVAGIWYEVFHEDTPTFVPQNGVPFDLMAAINGTRLDVLVIKDPDGAAEVYPFGPFDIMEATSNSGGIGVFSWGMARTEFDNVQVESVDGTALLVVSAVDTVDPAPGLHSFLPGTPIHATAISPSEVMPGVRRIINGWTGAGSVPASGAEGEADFVLNQLSVLAWDWTTNYRLNIEGGPGGSVDPEGEQWMDAGAVVQVTANPDSQYLFTGWSGDASSANPTLGFTLNSPRELVAHFSADSDGDLLPDDWELEFLGSLQLDGGDDRDLDGKNNLTEYRMGSNPAFDEVLTVPTPDELLESAWVNPQRDFSLPGQWVVHDFGDGYRGLFENSNDHRGADDTTFLSPENVNPLVSFEGPRLVIRDNLWDPARTNYDLEAVFTVGDNDGNCLYFRYVDEDNWYRVTVVGEDNNAAWRAPFGVSVQKKAAGVYTELAADFGIATDPEDVSWYKKIRVHVMADGPDFEVQVIGWNAFTNPPTWDLSSEIIIQFWDDAHPAGRIGVGAWGQNGGVGTPEIPVNAGVLIDDILAEVNGTIVFHEGWESKPLDNVLPDGWENPYSGHSTLVGNWRISAHGAILENGDVNVRPTGTVENPRADADAPMLIAPAPETPNYLLEAVLQSFDDDGIGLIYDYVDPDNYARVLFYNQPTGNTIMPQGVNVSRKIDGVWFDLFVEDQTFIYRPAYPFEVRLAVDNGSYHLWVEDGEDPSIGGTWNWQDQAPAAGNRFGLASWANSDAHFYSMRAWTLPERTVGPAEVKIIGLQIVGDTVVLTLDLPGDATFDVQVRTALDSGDWQTIAEDQSGTEWTGPVGDDQLFWRVIATTP